MVFKVVRATRKVVNRHGPFITIMPFNNALPTSLLISLSSSSEICFLSFLKIFFLISPSGVISARESFPSSVGSQKRYISVFILLMFLGLPRTERLDPGHYHHKNGFLDQ